ncbi:MAG: FliG C-terminal domain-containing protein [Bacteroidota bacterium]
MWGLSLVLIGALGLMLPQQRAIAQSIDGFGTGQSIELRIAQIEQTYDTQVIQILSNYFDQRSFFVDVKINAEMVEEVFTTTQNQSTAATRSPSLFMPGLPFVPEENIQRSPGDDGESAPVVSENTIRTLKLVNLSVNIFADTSFTDSELEFMRMIASLAAKTDRARGDEINVNRIPMPAISSPEPILPPEPVVTEPVAQTTPPEPKLSFMGQLIQLLPAFVLFALVMITMVVYRLLNKPQQAREAERTENRSSLRSQLSSANPAQAYLPPAPPSYQGYVPDVPPPSIHSEVDQLIERFFRNPKEIALMFEFWLDNDPVQGAKEAAEVVCTVDPNLLKSLKSDLKPELYQAIQDEIMQLPPLSQERKHQIAKRFNSLLQAGNTGSSAHKNNQLGLFKFLAHVSDYQITWLINGEDNQTAALILEYLPQEQAARVLDKLHKGRAANIMLEMTTLHTLSYVQQKEISARLLDKTMDLIEKEHSGQYEYKNLLPVLERLPLSDQRAYIDELIATGSPIGEVVDQHFVTVDQIPSLDDVVIKEAVQSFSTEQILNSLIGLDEQSIEKVLSSRPSREQRLIKLELEEVGTSADEGENEATVQLMKSIREVRASQNGASH